MDSWILLLFIFAAISFFVRTDSTTVLGCTPPDPYSAPVEEALPLACQPHLLNPAARREQMFGTVQEEADGSTTGTSQVNTMALFSAARGHVGQQAGLARDKSFFCYFCLVVFVTFPINADTSWTTIGDKIVDTLTISSPYEAYVLSFYFLR